MNSRRLIALLAAYVVVLQALLLPLSVAAGTQFSSTTLCVALADGLHAPSSHDGTCPCAAGCGMQCCGQALTAPSPVVIVVGSTHGLAIVPAPAIEPVQRPAGKGPQIPRAPPTA